MTDLNAVRAAIERWYRAALAAVEPGSAVRRALVSGQVAVPAPGAGRVLLVAVGKAADPMARAAAEALGGRIAAGVVLTKDGHLSGPMPEPLLGFEAAHPVPDGRGVAATERVLEVVRSASPDDLVLALISGGGSALLEAPRAPATLADVAATTDLLLRAGAPIQDLNAVRAPLSRVKGGGLRRVAPRARFATLVLSDVLGNDLRVIASGPTMPARRDAAGALAVLDRYDLVGRVPAPVLAVLRAPDDADELVGIAAHGGDAVVVVGDNAAAVAGARAAAAAEGLRSGVVWQEREGEARDLGRAWVEICRAADGGVDVVLGGGEATVSVCGNGIGGRNTEFALAAALALEEPGEPWVVASLATDGQDGPTGVAGAVADGGTAARSRAAGIDPAAALAANDSLAPFVAAGGIVAPGPTGTNVCDLYIGVRGAAGC